MSGATTPTREALRISRFNAFYHQVFPAFAGFIKQKGGDLALAKDLFQEALLLVYEQKLRHDQPVSEGYLFGICRHLWHQYRRQQRRQERWDNQTEPLTGEHYQEPSSSKILTLLSRAGERCLELLTSFYYHRQSMQEIAAAFGFSGERSATVQKYKCLEKVRDQVQQNQWTYEDFLA